MLIRVISTVTLVLLYGVFSVLFYDAAASIMSQVMGVPVDDSINFLQKIYEMSFYDDFFRLVFLVLLVVLILIWFTPIRNALRKASM